MRFSLVIYTPAVAGVGHVQLPLQVDDSEGRAAASHVVDLLLPLDLNILLAAQAVERVRNRERERLSWFSFFALVHKKASLKKCSKVRRFKRRRGKKGG